MEDFKALATFKAEVMEGLMAMYYLGFDDFKAHVAWLFLDINSNLLVLETSKDDGEGEPEAKVDTSDVVEEENNTKLAP